MIGHVTCRGPVIGHMTVMQSNCIDCRIEVVIDHMTITKMHLRVQHSGVEITVTLFCTYSSMCVWPYLHEVLAEGLPL